MTVNEAACASAIADLRHAIAAAAWPDALACGLAAWRAARAPAVADLVDALATRCEPPLPARPRHLRDLHAWWIAHAAAYDPVRVGELAATASLDLRGSPPWPQLRTRYPVGHPVIGPLVIAYGESFGSHPPTHLNLVDRLAAMAAWPADPRAAAPLCAWLCDGEVGWKFDEAPYGQAARVLYELVAAQLRRIGDARVVPALRACAAAPRGDSPALRATQTELAARTVAALGELPPLPDALAAAVAELLAAAPPLARAPAADPEAPLWAEIAAHPDDDAPRRVLADALLSRGDPRGELIALQCAGRAKTRAREAKLVRQHWRDWADELAPILARKRCVFERGMLHGIAVGMTDTPAGSYAGLRGRRELACVQVVRPASITAPDFATVLDAFDRLDTVDLALPGILPALRAVRPRWAFRCVELREASPPLHERDTADVIRELVALVPDLGELRVEANLWMPVLDRIAYLDELARIAPRVRLVLRAGRGFAERREDGDDRLAPAREREGVVVDDEDEG
jgi:uncharacterized protein (TIGR02996 family)